VANPRGISGEDDRRDRWSLLQVRSDDLGVLDEVPSERGDTLLIPLQLRHAREGDLRMREGQQGEEKRMTGLIEEPLTLG
jgi:hypothetical protein